MQERSGEVMFCAKKIRHQLEKGAVSMKGRRDTRKKGKGKLKP